MIEFFLTIGIGKAAFILLAVFSVVFTLVREIRNYEFALQIWRRFTVGVFVETTGVVLLTFALFLALREISILKHGWLRFFFNSDGNALITPIMEGSGSSHALIRAMPPIFFAVFVLVVPYVARQEEIMFRKGCDMWGCIIKRSIAFGLIHCLVGVPIAAGIALIVSGLFYGMKYKLAFDQNVKTVGRREAEDEATTQSIVYHSMYNTILGALLFLITAIAIY